MTNKKILTLISLLLFLFLLAGCFPKPNLPPEITSSPVETAKVGVAYTYKVVATDPNAGDVLTYSLTTEPSGMLINATSGVITWTPAAEQTGENEVVVVVSDDEGLSDTQGFTITVISPVEPVIELTGITVDPKTMTLIVEQFKAIESVTAHYSDGSETVLDLDACDYESSDEEVATVVAGEISAVAEGTATITVSYTEEKLTKTVYIEETDTLEVTVGAVEFDHIVVLPEEMTLYKGGVESKAITSITAYNNDGTKTTVAFGDCIYGLSDSSIATVKASTGEVTAVVLGETTITVSYEEEGTTKTDTIGVTVLAFELDYIVVEPEEMTLYKGEESKTITSVFAHYNDGTKAEIGLAACEYESSDEDVATVAIGVVTATTPAVGSGEATITVSYEEGEVTAEDFVAVTVENRPPVINISGAINNATVGTPYTCTISAIDPDDWDVLTYFLDTLIIGMNIGPENGNINWMPLSTDSGEVVTVVVGVSDGELSDTGSFDITVTGI